MSVRHSSAREHLARAVSMGFVIVLWLLSTQSVKAGVILGPDIIPATPHENEGVGFGVTAIACYALAGPGSYEFDIDGQVIQATVEGYRFIDGLCPNRGQYEVYEIGRLREGDYTLNVDIRYEDPLAPGVIVTETIGSQTFSVGPVRAIPTLGTVGLLFMSLVLASTVAAARDLTELRP